jgi:WD40 repeat protein
MRSVNRLLKNWDLKMKPLHVSALILLLLSSLSISAEPASGQDKEPAVFRDLYGDPLPPGAIARLGTTRLRHGGGWRLRDAAFSPDGKMLASFGGDRRLRVWDTANGKELQNTLLDSFSSDSPTVVFSGDGKCVAVTSYQEIALCAIGSSKPRILPEQPDYAKGLAFAPDGKLLAVYGYAKTVSLIDPATGKEVRQLKGHEEKILGAAFSVDGKTLATSSEDLTCRIWNVADGKQQTKLETNKVKAQMLDLSPDGKWIAWWDEDGEIHVHDVVTGKEKTSFNAANRDALFCLHWRYSAMRFTPDGTLESLYRGHFSQWHPEKGLKTREFKPVSGKTAYGRISPDGKKAVLWDWDHGTALHLFDLETGKEKEVGVGHLKPVHTVLAQPGGKLIASESSDGTIRLWDPANSKELRRWRPECVFRSVAFTPDGKALAFSDYDKKLFIRVVDLDTDKQLQRLDTESSHHLAFSGNGKLLLTAGSTRIEVWDVAQGKMLGELEDVPETKLPPLVLSEHAPWLTYFVHSPSISPDGTKAAAAFVRSRECSVYLWDTTTRKKLPDWPGNKQLNSPVAFSPDGKTLAVVQERKNSENDVVLWDFSREEIVKRFPVADISCNCVVFSRDGKLLALSGYYKSIVQVYEVASGKEIARFQAPAGPMTFSDDGATLITGSDDSTILIWDLRSQALRKK